MNLVADLFIKISSYEKHGRPIHRLVFTRKASIWPIISARTVMASLENLVLSICSNVCFVFSLGLR